MERKGDGNEIQGREGGRDIRVVTDGVTRAGEPRIRLEGYCVCGTVGLDQSSLSVGLKKGRKVSMPYNAIMPSSAISSPSHPISS